MDLGYFRRSGGRNDEAWAAAPDYAMLVATLSAMQAASAAARAASGGRRARAAAAAPSRPLVEILLGTAAWRAAVAAQGGSFHPGLAHVGER
jgi:hypothetical protein